MVGSRGFEGGIDSDGIVGLDFAKGVKVQLSHEGGEFRVLKVLRNNLLLEFRRILHDKCFSVFRP